MVLKTKWVNGPGGEATSKALEVLVILPLVAVMVSANRTVVIVTLPVQTPFTKVTEVGVMVVVRSERVTLPLKEVTVLFPASLAVTVMAKGVPAV